MGSGPLEMMSKCYLFLIRKPQEGENVVAPPQSGNLSPISATPPLNVTTDRTLIRLSWGTNHTRVNGKDSGSRSLPLVWRCSWPSGGEVLQIHPLSPY